MSKIQAEDEPSVPSEDIAKREMEKAERIEGILSGKLLRLGNYDCDVNERKRGWRESRTGRRENSNACSSAKKKGHRGNASAKKRSPRRVKMMEGEKAYVKVWTVPSSYKII